MADNATVSGVIARRYPTRLHAKCRGCGREASVYIFLEQVQKLRCSRCGSRQVTIMARDRLAAWARRRRGRA